MSFIEFKLIKLKNMQKYFTFQIKSKTITNDVNLFSKNNF